MKKNHVMFSGALVRHPKNVLDYFPEAKGDGSRITWFHGTNNRHSLEEALRSVFQPSFLHPPSTTRPL